MSTTHYTALVDTLTSKFDLPPDEATPQTSLGGSAVDSLALLELSLILEERLGFSVPEGALHTGQSLQEAAEALETLHASQPTNA
ncbi:phosphopantetheine-binding protein [Streptomyces sp. NPDC047967]|uniref:phosphopantetheine-binding protein n=1 Tax=Streptomyces sp. NPDC047967 TaxID=3154924 RepID=UPI0034017B5A